VYVNALHNLFVYDDHRMVVENLSIQHLFNLWAIVFHDVSRPIVNISYAIDHAMWGAQPFGFHLTNVLLHMVNVVLLFIVCTRFVEDQGKPHDGLVPFTAASVFAIHPMMTEAVGYVSGRSEVLCGVFVLSAFLCARRWMLHGGTRWWLLASGLWLAALGTKEIAVALPLVLFLYDRWVLRGSAAQARARFRGLHAPFIALAVTAAAIRLVVFAFVEYAGSTSIHWSYLLVECDVIRRYLTLMFVPEGQSIFHEVFPIALFSTRAAVAAGTVVLVGAGAWVLRRRDAMASLGLIWFLLFLIPSSVLVVLDRGEPMAEHRVYLASCGLFLAVAALVGRLAARLPAGSPRVRAARRVLAALVLISLGGRTVLRNVVWGNPVVLWTEARDKAPDHWLPHLLLGEALHEMNRSAEAVAEYERAIVLRPEETMSYQKLGVCLIEMERLNEAAGVYETLRRREPQSPMASIGLGAVAMVSGEPARARAFFRETIDHDARNVVARQSLAMLAESEPQGPAEALRLCTEIRQIAPDTAGNDDCIRRNQMRVAAPQFK
jgi:hypothetical protein